MERDPIFIFDLGGDQNLFWNTWELAVRQGRTFRFLTLDGETESFFFPPFQAIPIGQNNVIRIAQMLIAAFHMEHGLIYGGNYYSQQNLAALLRVARKLVRSAGNPTLDDIAKYLDDPTNRREFKDADQVRMTFDFLLEYAVLRSVGDAEREIDVERAVDHSEVIYFFCPTMEEPLTAPLVAGLGLYTLLAICIRRKRAGKPRRRVRIIIDEFQEIIGRSLSRILAQCRKFDIPTLVLANQSTSQLVNRDLSLAEQVFEGSFLRQYFTSLGRDIEDLQLLANTVVDITQGINRGGLLDVNFQEREDEVPGLHQNSIRDVSSRFGFSFVCLNDGSGHRDPIIIQQTHSTPDYSDKPMPRRSRTPDTAAETASDPGPGRRMPLDDPDRQARHKLLRQLITTCEAEERWRGGA